MDLALVTTEQEGLPVLSVSGEVDLATLPQFRDALLRLTSEHPGPDAVVDLDGVGVLDDTALGLLLGARRRLRSRGGQLHLVASVPRVVELLTASGLDTLLPIHATLSEAGGVIRGR
jgi:anti-sigma B factor antagonist